MDVCAYVCVCVCVCMRACACARVCAGAALPPSVWVADAEAKHCADCGLGFGVSRRKHHCRACGHIFCWACSDAKCEIDDRGDLAALQFNLPYVLRNDCIIEDQRTIPYTLSIPVQNTSCTAPI